MKSGNSSLKLVLVQLQRFRYDELNYESKSVIRPIAKALKTIH
jgi:hypothetical protein